MNVIIVISVIAVLTAAITFLGAYLLIRTAFFYHEDRDRRTMTDLMLNPANTNESRDNIVWLFKRLEAGKSEEMSVKSFDGLSLNGLFLPSDKCNNRLIICFHGYTATGLYEFGHMVRFFHEKGFDVLLPDMRAHGRSEGKITTMGTLERKDIKPWVELAQEKFPDRDIYLMGVSMGGASVLGAASTLPEGIKGIVADSVFTNANDTIKRCCKTLFNIPLFPLFYAARLMCRLFYGWNFKEYAVDEALTENKTIPVLFIHGGNDKVAPPQSLEINFSKCAAPKKAYLDDEAGHAQCSFNSPDNYYKALSDFFDFCDNQ